MAMFEGQGPSGSQLQQQMAAMMGQNANFQSGQGIYNPMRSIGFQPQSPFSISQAAIQTLGPMGGFAGLFLEPLISQHQTLGPLYRGLQAMSVSDPLAAAQTAAYGHFVSGGMVGNYRQGISSLTGLPVSDQIATMAMMGDQMMGGMVSRVLEMADARFVSQQAQTSIAQASMLTTPFGQFDAQRAAALRAGLVGASTTNRGGVDNLNNTLQSYGLELSDQAQVMAFMADLGIRDRGAAARLRGRGEAVTDDAILIESLRAGNNVVASMRQSLDLSTGQALDLMRSADIRPDSMEASNQISRLIDELGTLADAAGVTGQELVKAAQVMQQQFGGDVLVNAEIAAQTAQATGELGRRNNLSLTARGDLREDATRSVAALNNSRALAAAELYRADPEFGARFARLEERLMSTTDPSELAAIVAEFDALARETPIDMVDAESIAMASEATQRRWGASGQQAFRVGVDQNRFLTDGHQRYGGRFTGAQMAAGFSRAATDATFADLLTRARGNGEYTQLAAAYVMANMPEVANDPAAARDFVTTLWSHQALDATGKSLNTVAAHLAFGESQRAGPEVQREAERRTAIRGMMLSFGDMSLARNALQIWTDGQTDVVSALAEMDLPKLISMAAGDADLGLVQQAMADPALLDDPRFESLRQHREIFDRLYEANRNGGGPEMQAALAEGLRTSLANEAKVVEAQGAIRQATADQAAAAIEEAVGPHLEAIKGAYETYGQPTVEFLGEILGVLSRGKETADRGTDGNDGTMVAKLQVEIVSEDGRARLIGGGKTTEIDMGSVAGSETDVPV